MGNTKQSLEIFDGTYQSADIEPSPVDYVIPSPMDITEPSDDISTSEFFLASNAAPPPSIDSIDAQKNDSQLYPEYWDSNHQGIFSSLKNPNKEKKEKKKTAGCIHLNPDPSYFEASTF